MAQRSVTSLLAELGFGTSALKPGESPVLGRCPELRKAVSVLSGLGSFLPVRRPLSRTILARPAQGHFVHTPHHAWEAIFHLSEMSSGRSCRPAPQPLLREPPTTAKGAVAVPAAFQHCHPAPRPPAVPGVPRVLSFSTVSAPAPRPFPLPEISFSLCPLLTLQDAAEGHFSRGIVLSFPTWASAHP